MILTPIEDHSPAPAGRAARFPSGGGLLRFQSSVCATTAHVALVAASLSPVKQIALRQSPTTRLPRMDLPQSITLSREEAGLRQLVMAITVFRLGRYECAITLAGAAEDLFLPRPDAVFEYLKHAPPPPGREEHPFAKLAPEERGKVLNDVRNWLKHRDRPPHIRDITQADAETAIARAFTRANTLTLEVMMPDWAVEQWEWFKRHMGAA